MRTDPVIPLAYGGYSSPFFFISLCNSRAKSGVVSILQFIEQVLRIDTLELAVLHLAQLPEGMINLGKRLLLRRGSRAHHVGLAVRPAHLCNHLLEEADLVIGDVDCNCRHNVVVFNCLRKDTKFFRIKTQITSFFTNITYYIIQISAKTCKIMSI